MTATHKQITEALGEIGAAWAIRSNKFVDVNDPLGSRPAYHIHPDATYPHQDSIRRFSNLEQIQGYIAAHKQAQEAATNIEAMQIMENFNASLA